MKYPQIAVVDDHTLVRSGILTILRENGFEKVVSFNNGEEIVKYCRQNSPDIVLMDINMPTMNGFEATAALREINDKIKVVALSMNDSDIALIKMLKAGAKSFIPKNAPTAELINAIHMVLEKGFYYSSFVSERLIQTLGTRSLEDDPNILDNLNDRELEFLKLACSELTYREIADRMHLSHRSIDNYRDALFKKLNIKSRVGLAIFAIKHDLVKI